jgi:hypothetical protein
MTGTISGPTGMSRAAGNAVRDKPRGIFAVFKPMVEGYRGKKLIKAIQYGHMENAEGLIREGANVNIRGRWGMTALMHVGRPGVTELLIKAGANVNAADNEGKTVLMHAVGKGSYDVNLVELLIKAGANVNAANYGETVLMQALRDNKFDMAELLIKARANVNATDNEGKTALARTRAALVFCNSTRPSETWPGQDEFARIPNNRSESDPVPNPAYDALKRTISFLASHGAK